MTALTDSGFLLSLVVLLVMTLILVLVARMKDKAQVHTAFMILISTLIVWALGAAILQYAYLQGLPTWRWAVGFAYVGLILTPVAILYLGVVFAQTRVKLNWVHALILVVPLVSIFMAFVNPNHLFYVEMDYATLTQSSSLGPYFLFHTVYSYLCILGGMGFLVVFSIKNAGFFSRQSFLILAGIVVSFGYNILVTVQAFPGVLFHTNVVAFFVSVLLFYFAILRFDFLSVVPIALQRVVDHISDSFLVLDKVGRVIDYNATFTATFGGICRIRRKETLEELVASGRCVDEFGSLLMEIHGAVIRRETARFERSVVVDGAPRYFTVEVSALTTTGDVHLSTVVLLKDVTDLKNAMDEIARNSEALMEKERLASLGQLIGGIAHNLKTPIMSIAGATEGLKDLVEEYEQSIDDPTVTPDDHREIAREMKGWIGKITPHTAYMSEIISTVKDQMSIDSVSPHSAFTLDELLKRVDLLMKHELKQFHCELVVDRRTGPNARMRGDVSSLVQVFDNLILNAIHAYEGRRGQIDLSVREDSQNLLFEIADHGKGIPLAVQEKLFKEMVTTKGKGGTGLGLFISASTVKVRYGGRIWFESEPGNGTTFHISIPSMRNENEIAPKAVP